MTMELKTVLDALHMDAGDNDSRILSLLTSAEDKVLSQIGLDQAPNDPVFDEAVIQQIGAWYFQPEDTRALDSLLTYLKYKYRY